MHTGRYGIRAGLRYTLAPRPWVWSQLQRKKHREDSSGTGTVRIERLTEIMRNLLGVEGTAYNCVDANGHIPLMMAAGRSRYDAVAELLELEGMKVDSRDNERMTALAHAISNDHLETLRNPTQGRLRLCRVYDLRGLGA
ncbi:hypothetical protein FA15DRAFT_675803 [Coprinopsis marcescibilis]|uniref:Uncharacterized protein n=1 Tax=Coprinopsis marcescibilis TaxID=230819 RepID=A0A5C3KCX2_COPMA|nr:hypothetical protein FA15DRAFT_675803 [Coprinopsis marcescibilis]